MSGQLFKTASFAIIVRERIVADILISPPQRECCLISVMQGEDRLATKKNLNAFVTPPDYLRANFRVRRLGECQIPSPLKSRTWVGEEARIIATSEMVTIEGLLAQGQKLPSFEAAGPRDKIYFDPARTRAAIVTCGGLCPGLNNVIRTLVVTLKDNYGLRDVIGIRYGYWGLAKHPLAEPIQLTHDLVDDIHLSGGSVLSSSRGTPPVSEIADTLERLGVDILFTVGGDGTLRGAREISEELTLRHRHTSVIGIPKTIDNDIHWVDRSFGFTTAVAEAQRAIQAAHAEARGAWNGIGIVKLMGRHSGFLAAHAALSGPDVNFCLIPEVRLELEGPLGLLAVLKTRIEKRHHAVIIVAEGTGQHLLPSSNSRDPSGNLRLSDIGLFLQSEISRRFNEIGVQHTIKYIDPSYTVRGLPCAPIDAEFCSSMAQAAVHAGMAGRTAMFIGLTKGKFVHVPMGISDGTPRVLDPSGPVWQRVLDATRQPALWS